MHAVNAMNQKSLRLQLRSRRTALCCILLTGAAAVSTVAGTRLHNGHHTPLSTDPSTNSATRLKLVRRSSTIPVNLRALLEAATFAAEDAYPPTDLETRANMFRGMGNIFEVPRQVMFVSAAASLPGVQLIGEIGFNAGHSAITALWSNENATLVSFDTQDLDWSKQSLSFVSRIYPHRIDRVKGPSQVTIPVFASKDARKLDMLFVDGVHSGDTPYLDIVNGRLASLPHAYVMIDDWSESFPDVQTAWQRAKREGVIEEILCETESGRFNGFAKGYCLGKYL